MLNIHEQNDDDNCTCHMESHAHMAGLAQACSTKKSRTPGTTRSPRACSPRRPSPLSLLPRCSSAFKGALTLTLQGRLRDDHASSGSRDWTIEHREPPGFVSNPESPGIPGDSRAHHEHFGPRALDELSAMCTSVCEKLSFAFAQIANSKINFTTKRLQFPKLQIKQDFFTEGILLSLFFSLTIKSSIFCS